MSARGPDVSATPLVIARSSFRTRRCAISTSISRRPIAQDVREEGHQSPKGRDVSDSPGSDALDPPEQASRRKRVRVEVQYERPVGW